MAAMAKKIDTGATLLAAAKKVLRKSGYSALSTRDVAAAAGVPLSQIHYHFGSKDGMMLALFEYLNDELLDRQQAMFGNPALKLSEQWDLACTYLDEDLASGYVRVLQELWAAGYSNPQIAKVVRAGDPALAGFADHSRPQGRGALWQFCRSGTRGCGGPGERCLHRWRSLCPAGAETRELPIRKALRRVGDLIRRLEAGQSKR